MTVWKFDSEKGLSLLTRGRLCERWTPRAGVRSVLNRPPLDCERPREGPGFDGLAKRQLL